MRQGAENAHVSGGQQRTRKQLIGQCTAAGCEAAATKAALHAVRQLQHRASAVQSGRLLVGAAARRRRLDRRLNGSGNRLALLGSAGHCNSRSLASGAAGHALEDAQLNQPVEQVPQGLHGTERKDQDE